MNKHVVFTTLVIGARERKIAYWLRRNGWRVTIMTVAPSNEPETCFDAVHYFNSLSDFVNAARSERATIHHAFCKINDSKIAYALLVSGITPVVVDHYDLISTVWQDEATVPAYAEAERPFELESIVRAQGICSRSLLIQGLKRAGIFPEGKPTIYFPEYIWGDIPLLPKLRHNDGQLHFVYAGTVPQLQDFLPFIELYNSKGFSIDFYPNYNPAVDGIFEQRYAQYFEYARHNPLLRFHRPIFGADLITEISKYDVMFGYDIELLFGKYIRYNKYSGDRWYSNKFSDCIEAGVFWVANPGLLGWLSNRLGVGAGIDNEQNCDDGFWNDVRNRLDNIDFQRARDRWSSEKNIHRLISFYESLSS